VKHVRNESGGDSRQPEPWHQRRFAGCDSEWSKNESAPVAEDGSEDGGDRTTPGKGLDNVPCASHANLTPSGKSAGGWPQAANWVASFPLVSWQPVRTRFCLDSIPYQAFTAACRYSTGREFLSDAPFFGRLCTQFKLGNCACASGWS